MENAMMIAKIAGPAFLVMGLSVIFYPSAWQKVVSEYEKNHLSMLTMAFLSMILGLIIINMYNDWTWNVWILVTFIGWLALVKSVFYFLVPGSWTKGLLKSYKNKAIIALDGVACLAIGAVLSYYSYMI